MKTWISAQQIAAADTREAQRHVSALRPIGHTQAAEIRRAVAK